ncbi:small secreted protein [Streptomyces sp. JB150]|uniref:small secreted protein n=1 Tax=Streptomyces sp. JB150 TaxID=2714844 RepID=UPI001408D593|nr:small secreted protein [Streptomyces sp. JB150]QIJ63936.1 small secreted protein [Streptomyces sp. JB150]
MEGTKPVNKKLAAALSGGAVLVLALSGCTGDDGNEELDAWAKQVCDELRAQATTIKAANAAIQQETSDNSTPAEVQQADSKAFQDIADAYKAIGGVITKAGPPNVEDGKKKQQDAVKELNAISASYGSLKEQVDALNTKDQAKFAAGLKDVAAEMKKLGKTGSDALKALEEGEVGQAMAKQQSCKSASASATPSAAQG